MADIAKIRTENVDYDIKDRIAREVTAKTPFNRIFIATFFESQAPFRIHFMTSLDGESWSEFNKDVVLNGRDPQITYNPVNKKFYLCITNSSTTHDFICYTSSDLINWEQHLVDMNIKNGVRWAPELFFDTDGKCYATISYGVDTSNMQIYMAECTDIENFTFGPYRQLNLGSDKYIDANLCKHNGTYYLTTKTENTAKIVLHSSNDLTIFTEINSDVVGGDIPCEGGQVLNVNGRWLFYGDTWQSYGNYGVMQTDDLSDFGYLIVNDSLRNMRHGTVLYIEDLEVVQIATRVPDYSNAKITKLTQSQIILNGNYDSVIVYPNFFYRIGGDVTINKITNPYNLQFMPFKFTTNRGAKLTINNLPNKTDKIVIYNSRGENEKLQLIALQGDGGATGRRIETISATDLIEITDSTQWSVSIYGAKRINDRVFFQANITKLVASASVAPFTVKAAYAPVGVVPVNNDKGVGGIFIRENGTFGGPVNSFTQNNAAYCYLSYDIY